MRTIDVSGTVRDAVNRSVGLADRPRRRRSQEDFEPTLLAFGVAMRQAKAWQQQQRSRLVNLQGEMLALGIDAFREKGQARLVKFVSERYLQGKVPVRAARAKADTSRIAITLADNTPRTSSGSGTSSRTQGKTKAKSSARSSGSDTDVDEEDDDGAFSPSPSSAKSESESEGRSTRRRGTGLSQPMAVDTTSDQAIALMLSEEDDDDDYDDENAHGVRIPFVLMPKTHFLFQQKRKRRRGGSKKTGSKKKKAKA